MTITRPGPARGWGIWYHARIGIYRRVDPEVSHPVEESVKDRVAVPVWRRVRRQVWWDPTQ